MDACQLKPGDILACYGSDRVSRFVSLWTGSLRRPARLRIAPSHVGICVEHPQRGMLLVESTSLCGRPCLFRGKPVSGVQAHYPETRINDYVVNEGRVDVWRLNAYWELSTAENTVLWQLLARHLGDQETLYDMRGAITSGTRLLCKILTWLETDLERVFCSELIAAALMRLHRMPLANATRYNPGRLLRQLYSLNVYQFAGHANCNFHVVRQEE